jgi:hypothetical protein
MNTTTYQQNFITWYKTTKVTIFSVAQVKDHLWVVFVSQDSEYKTQLFNADTNGLGNTSYHATWDEGFNSFTDRVKLYQH